MKLNYTIWITIFLLCAIPAVADQDISQPDNPGDPFANSGGTLFSIFKGDSALPPLDITLSTSSIMGSECSNLYTSTGHYCSGHLRIYYQCLPTMDGGEWQQRSENCGDYPGGGRCSQGSGKAECVDYLGDTTHGKKLLWWGIGLIILGLVLGFFVHPLFFIIAIIGIYTLYKFFLGGV